MSSTFGSDLSASGSDPHPIEFPCGGCGRVLKVPAAAAGRQAKCPQCGTLRMVPNQSSVTPPAAFGQNPAFFPPNAPTGPNGTSAAPPAPGLQPMSFGGSAPMFPPNANAGNPPTTPNAWPQSVQQPSPMGFGQPTQAAVVAPAQVGPMSIANSLHNRVGNETPTKQLFDRIMSEIGKVYVGQDELVLGALVALFSSGHVLIESVPGLGKTLFVRTLGKVLGCKFGRIQFTADLMPSDITGAPIFDMKMQEFRFREGPVFTQFLLADEINRAPAKTHAALLEIMQEFRVTVDGKSHTLERPFLVLATQNPIESEGTYNLPEAQLDRFMFKLVANYPSELEENRILKLHGSQQDINLRLEDDLETVTSPIEILHVTRDNANVRIDDRLLDYINKVVRLTRKWPQFHMGASPRAGIALVQASRTLAAFNGRDYAVPDDVVQIALFALRHRVILTAEAEVEGRKVDDILTELIRSVEVPRL